LVESVENGRAHSLFSAAPREGGRGRDDRRRRQRRRRRSCRRRLASEKDGFVEGSAAVERPAPSGIAKAEPLGPAIAAGDQREGGPAESGIVVGADRQEP